MENELLDICCCGCMVGMFFWFVDVMVGMCLGWCFVLVWKVVFLVVRLEVFI